MLNFLQYLLYFILGIILSNSGLSIITWQFWVVLALVIGIDFISAFKE